jgi:ABC-2 type transport system ATP-binding protein
MLIYAGRLHEVPSDRLERRADEVLELAGLANVRSDLVEWLSHGYRQRVGIATAILHEPKLVVLDEPISGLDPAQIVAMRGLIRGLKEKHTVLLSSHILSEISMTCDRILMLHQGRIVATGTEAELVEGGGTRVEVIARGSLADVEKADLKAMAGVSRLEAKALAGGLVSLRADLGNDDAREALVRALVQQGFGVRAVQDVESGLESVFLKLTRPGAGASETASLPGGAA